MSSSSGFDLSSDDPSILFLQGLQQSSPNDVSHSQDSELPRRSTGGRSGSPNESGEEEEFEKDMSIGPQNSPPNPLDSMMPGGLVAETCRQLKKRKQFSPESEAELEVFASTKSMEGHMALLFASNLEVRDLIKQARKEEAWTIPDALQDNLRTYATAFVLCHNLSSYRGKLANKLMDALRELNISNLPPVKENARTKEVISCVSKYLTQARNNIKNSIKASVDESNEKGNVAHLANTVIGKTGFQPTVQLYMRLAFLRWHYINYSNLEPDQWWVQVDSTLLNWRTLFKSATELSNAFNKMYSDDKNRFGDPAHSGRSAVDGTSLPAWQVTLQAHARDVEAITKKRKRT